VLTFRDATLNDVAAIASLQNAAAAALTARFGRGHWSSVVTERNVELSLRHARLRLGIAGASVVQIPRLAALARDDTHVVIPSAVEGSAPLRHPERSRGIRTPPSVLSTLRLATKKPWAIDVSYFTPLERPLYLTGMAISVAHQGQGLGRLALDDARATAEAWPADGIRLDAYDAPAGAGEFYAKCGYAERGRVVYKGDPLVYYELLLG
jgi:GNAT superfamily N-acetyltransferase